MKRAILAILGAVLGLAGTLEAAEREPPPFVVHEWGTFTALQNDDGQELPGINIDDEPVPPFVHNLAPYLLNQPVLSTQHWQYRQKGAPRQHPRITMRLETPVLYFYPGNAGTLPKKVDVDVAFRGGWLTEFYPWAKADAPGLDDGTFDFGPIAPDTLGRLTWRGVALNTEAKGPQTREEVWLAPRRVQAVDLSVSNRSDPDQPLIESERYLFYRGVANQRAPLRVSTDRETKQLTVRANFADVDFAGTDTIDALWLVDVRRDGQVAYRSLAQQTVTSDPQRIVTIVSSRFQEVDYASQNLARLREEMHAALVRDGLFADEATAMLTTWRRAYFESPGLRLFFLLPRSWTDHYLPLIVSGQPEITRVMMGRIELMTDEQRQLLRRLAKGPVTDGRWLEKIPDSPAKEMFLAGRSDFGELGVKIPADYQAYLDLGRFRNALVVAAARQGRQPALESFVEMYQLAPYQGE